MAAIVALVVGAATLALAVAVAVSEFPRGLGLLACVVVAGASAWYGVLRRGAARVAGLTVAGWRSPVPWCCSSRVGRRSSICWSWRGCWCRWRAARAALAVHVDLPDAPAPRQPVLFFNPRSGGGKAERFALADRGARARDRADRAEARRGSRALVRGAVDRGADALAMAGGDGSQAIVAALAAEHGLPYACVPAGTRNHFALDLGVDRDDVVGALDAFVDGGERTVDLAEVNGRVFVNNVSLGLYAEAVQREGYRDAKLRTLLDTVPDVLGPGGGELDLRWTGPGGHDAPLGCGGARLQQPLPARPRRRLGHPPADRRRPARHHRLRRALGTRRGRPRLQRPWREWAAPAFEVDADSPVPAGIDGEALVLDPPLRFRIRPGVLRVRIARQHPGASPSAMAPEGIWAGVLGAGAHRTGGR